MRIALKVIFQSGFHMKENMGRINIKDTLSWIYSIYKGTDVEIIFIPESYSHMRTRSSKAYGRAIIPFDGKFDESNPIALILCKSLLKDDIEMKAVILHELGHIFSFKKRGNREYNAQYWAIKKSESLRLKDVTEHLKDNLMDWFFDGYKRKNNFSYLEAYRKAGEKAHKKLFNMFDRYTKGIVSTTHD